MYLASLIRCIMALHDLVNNKIKYKVTDDAAMAKLMSKEAGKGDEAKVETEQAETEKNETKNDSEESKKK